MGVRISDIVNANATPGVDDRYETSRLVSTGPDVWETDYITHSQLKADILNSAALTTGVIPYYDGTDLADSPLSVAVADVRSSGDIYLENGKYLKSATGIGYIDFSSDTAAILGFDDGVNGGTIGVDANSVTLTHDLEMIFNSPLIQIGNNVDTTQMIIVGVLASFEGVQYSQDYSANYTARSLTDYGFSEGRYGKLSGKLSQFAATSSAELASVITDEVGTGALVFKTYVDGLDALTLKIANNLSDVNNKITARQNLGIYTAYVASTVNTTSNVMSDVTGMTVAVAANKKYIFVVHVSLNGPGSGVNYTLTFPASSTLRGDWTGNSTDNIQRLHTAQTASGAVVGSFDQNTAGQGFIDVVGFFETTNSGNIVLQHASAVNTESTDTYIGTFMKIIEVG